MVASTGSCESVLLSGDEPRVSLALRRTGPGSLRCHRQTRPWRLVLQMAGFALPRTLLNVALLIPVVDHLSGERQEVRRVR